jgi:hypothetical protein
MCPSPEMLNLENTKLALSKGTNRVGVSPPSREDVNRSGFRNVVLEIWTMDKVHKQNLLWALYTPSSEPFRVFILRALETCCEGEYMHVRRNLILCALYPQVYFNIDRIESEEIGWPFIYEMQNLCRKHQQKMSPRRTRSRQNNNIKMVLRNASFYDCGYI